MCQPQKKRKEEPSASIDRRGAFFFWRLGLGWVGLVERILHPLAPVTLGFRGPASLIQSPAKGRNSSPLRGVHASGPAALAAGRVLASPRRRPRTTRSNSLRRWAAHGDLGSNKGSPATIPALTDRSMNESCNWGQSHPCARGWTGDVVSNQGSSKPIQKHPEPPLDRDPRAPTARSKRLMHGSPTSRSRKIGAALCT